MSNQHFLPFDPNFKRRTSADEILRKAGNERGKFCGSYRGGKRYCTAQNGRIHGNLKYCGARDGRRGSHLK